METWIVPSSGGTRPPKRCGLPDGHHQLEQLLRQRLWSQVREARPRPTLALRARDPRAAQWSPNDARTRHPRRPRRRNPRPGHGRKPLAREPASPAGRARRPRSKSFPAPIAAPCGQDRRGGPRATRICAGQADRHRAHPAQVRLQGCQGNIVIAERLPEPIEKGLPGPGLLAQVAVSKYADHLPLYRQEGIFRRHGVELSRQTMCDWMADVAGLLEPIWKVMLGGARVGVVQTDDTPVTVLDPTARGSSGRLWVYLGDRDHPYTVYDFTADRSGDGPRADAQGIRGLSPGRRVFGIRRLFTDGKIVEVGCWMHARRKFYEARTTDPPRAHQALAWIACCTRSRRKRPGRRRVDDAAGTRTLCLRQQRSRPILEASRSGWTTGAAEGAAQEPDRRGDRLCVEPLGGVDPISGGGLPGDRQRRQRAGDEAGGHRPEELAVRRE